jgi:hypothetical protein
VTLGRAKATIDGGIRGFQTRVAAEADDACDVRFSIETDSDWRQTRKDTRPLWYRAD